MAETAHEPHRWTREEYERIVAAGVFHPEARLELIDGEVIRMTPQGSRHATAVALTQAALRQAFGAAYHIRIQMPLALDTSSEPEPDVAVVAGAPRDYRDAHPSTAVLVVEVADSSLDFERNQKKWLYARNGIQELWLVDLRDNRLEVYRGPHADDYGRKETLSAGDTISALASPDATFKVADLLP